MNTSALDFESFYSNECSITTLGPRGYFSHPDFDAYMVTVAGSDGFTYAGHPSGFNWELLNGQRVLSHNASFDESLYLFGVEKGWFPATSPAEWHCTSDMCSFLGLPRSLKNASAAVLGVKVDKSVRDNMKNKKWDAMTDEFRESVTTYAIGDAELCLKLWDAIADQWPMGERKISRVNREIGQRGLPIDARLLESNLVTIKTALFNAEQSIPWIGESTPLSRKAFNQKCREDGIIPPASLAKDNVDTEKWFDKNQEQCPWARAVQDFRRINAFLRKLESFDFGTMSDGRYYGGLMYCGANPTARFSGSGGNLNLQNLPRGDMFGVSFRSMIKPKPGYKLIVADLSQIEVRTLCWLSKDTKALELIRNSEDIYHAFGVMLGMHDPANGQLKEFDSKLRHKVKSMVLGCGYGIGAARFAEFSGMTLPEAEAAVTLYRERMVSVVRYWRSFNEDLSMCTALNQPLELSLPSGRTLRYGMLRRMREAPKKTGDMIRFKYLCKMVRNGAPRDLSLWGGILAENLSQGLARDIFADMMLRVDEAGYPIILHVHDELVCEVPEEQAEQALSDIMKIMSTPPEWIPDIPLSAEAHILDAYTK